MSVVSRYRNRLFHLALKLATALSMVLFYQQRSLMPTVPDGQSTLAINR